MLIQGTNTPLAITFEDDVSNVPVLVISLWKRKGIKLKSWTIENIVVDGDTVYCPLEEQETADFPEGAATLEVKGLDENGQTMFWEKAQVLIESRSDRVIKLTGG